jgi:hypothetical protein
VEPAEHCYGELHDSYLRVNGTLNKEVGRECVARTLLAKVRVPWRAVANAAMDIPSKARSLLNS